VPGQQATQPNEAQLVAQAQAGQVRAMGTLFAFYQDRLYNLAFQLRGGRDDAAELVQETMLRAIKGINQFHKKAKFYTWVVRIMINLANDLRNRHRRETVHLANRAREILKHSQAAQAIARDNPVAALEADETARIVRRELDSLQPQMKHAMILREIEQFSYRQIAQILNVSEGTVKSRLFRARETLRTALRPYVEGN